MPPLSVSELVPHANESTAARSEKATPLAKLILPVALTRGTDSLLAEGLQQGVPTYSMARYIASRVADAEARTVHWKMARLRDGRYPLQGYKQSVLEALG
jgi:hypothetical protein